MLLWTIILTTAALYGLSSVIYPKRLRASRFAEREQLSVEQIFSQFYGNSGMTFDLFKELWKEASESLAVPEGKLRPTDRLNVELGPVKSFPLVDVNEEFISRMAYRLKRYHRKVDELASIRSVNDYMVFFGNLEMSSK